MAPSACLSPVVTLALLLLTTGFALGGHRTFSKKRHHRHAMIARFLPLANDSAAFSPHYRTHHRHSQGHNISTRWWGNCPTPHTQRTYRVVVWTTDRYHGGTDADVRIKLAGPMCHTGWHDLDDTWINNFEKGSGDSFSFNDVDIGPKVAYVYIHYLNPGGDDSWYLTKIDTYYKSVKKCFYWNNWVSRSIYVQLRRTGSNAFAVTACMTTVVVFVVTTWFLM